MEKEGGCVWRRREGCVESRREDCEESRRDQRFYYIEINFITVSQVC